MPTVTPSTGRFADALRKTAGSFWTWREQMYAVADRLDPDCYRELARAIFAEMTLAGMTAVGEFHYLHHDTEGRRYADPNAMGTALIEAAREAGIRITLLDACYLSGGLDGNGHRRWIRSSNGSATAAWRRGRSGWPRCRDSPTARIGSAAALGSGGTGSSIGREL